MPSRLSLRIAWHVSRFFPRKLRLSDLESIRTEDISFFGSLSVLPAFRETAKTIPFYRKILRDRKVDIDQIKTLSDFSKNVPILKKVDIFQKFGVRNLCKNGRFDDVCGAIVTSGTSGAFAYNLLTREDTEIQRKTLDAFFEYYYGAENKRILIINALAMGVSFVSKHPILNSSIRSDIAAHFIKTFGNHYERMIVICDPNFAKRILDQGAAAGISWKETPVSFIVGGAWASNSLIKYISDRIDDKERSIGNTVAITMGITEIGLNIFNAPPELVRLRNIIQNDRKLLSMIFGNDETVCPEIMYYYPTRTYIEIAEADDSGIGNIVMSNLDTKSKMALFRYTTGDQGKFLSRDTITEYLAANGYDFSFQLGLPIIAVYDRERGNKGERDDAVSIAEMKEALFSDDSIAPFFTGHFKMIPEKSSIEVQLEKGIEEKEHENIKSLLETSVERISGKRQAVHVIPYQDFRFDMNLDYERKWNHSR